MVAEGYPSEDDERVLRMTKLEIEIEKGRLETQRLQQEIRADGRKFMTQAGITVAALVSASVALTAVFLPRATNAPPAVVQAVPAPAPQIIIIQAPPGTVATVVPPASGAAPASPVPAPK